MPWYKAAYSLKVIRTENTSVRSSRYLCLCYTSPVISAYTCTWASLHCCENITFAEFCFQVLYSLVARSKSLSLSLRIPCTFSCLALWNSAMCLILLLFHMSSSTISTAEAIYEMYVCRFFICKSIGYFDYPSVLQHSPTVQVTSQDIQNSKLQQCYSLH